MNHERFLQLTQFYQDYAAAVDAQDWDQWLNFFDEECTYRIQPRENYERNLPMAALSLTNKGMLKDRVYGITETIFHDPYMQHHIISAPRITEDGDKIIKAQANYAVFRTKYDGIAQVFNVGRYIDEIRITDDGLKLVNRICVFDNDMILNSLIYPI